MTRDEVLKEFYATPSVPGGASDRMADEIVRLRGELRDMHTKVFHLEEKLAWTERERDQLTSLPAERLLAALREPSNQMIYEVLGSYYGNVTKFVQALVAAAEREVDHLGEPPKWFYRR